MKNKYSKGFWVVSGLVILNLVIFILISGFFLNQVHHHWILPAASALIALEMLLAEFLAGRWMPDTLPTFRKTLLITLLFFCLVGAARHYTIFTCIENCGLKLGLMYELAAGVFAVSAFRFQKEGDRTWTRLSGLVGFFLFAASAVCFFIVMHWGRN